MTIKGFQRQKCNWISSINVMYVEAFSDIFCNDKSNNCATNLEWCIDSDNNYHKKLFDVFGFCLRCIKSK